MRGLAAAEQAGAGAGGDLVFRQTDTNRETNIQDVLREREQETVANQSSESPVPSGSTTITQTFYVTINNPSSDLDIERSLAEAAGRVAPGSGNA